MPSQKGIVYPEVRLKHVLAAFWRGAKPQKWLLFATILAVVIATALGIYIPVFYKKFFDIISGPQNSGQISGSLIGIITQVFIIQLIAWVFWRLNSFAVAAFEAKSIARLKQQVYDYLMDHSYSFFVNNFAGSLVQKVNRFARAFEQLADRLLYDVLTLFTRLIFIFIILFFYNPTIAWIILAWVLIFLLSSLWFAIWKLKYDIAVAEIDSKTTGYLSDTITNQNTIQLFASKKIEAEGYENITNEQAKKTLFSWNLSAIMDAIQSVFNIIFQFALFFFAIIFWAKGLISIGVFAMIQSYVFVIVDNTWGFSRVIRNIYQAYADSKEMVEIILLPHEIKDLKGATELAVKEGKIEFKNLTLSFNKTRQVLNDISLTINPGEKVALIGPSGAGKTTFVRLLLRLYSATSGKILIDGQDISQVTQESLRKNISMVPQDPILFHRTLAQNIAYGKRDAKMSDIEEAARLAHCDDFIANLPYKFDTFVGERGIKLSGGERQRVAIARAILKNAPILVLDEATSSLDSNSEMLIQDALNNLMQNKTVIVIAHRLSTIQKMDRIIVVDGGKIIEQGSHSELLAKENSLYKKLWELQAGGFLKSESDEAETEENLEEEDEKYEGGAKLANF
jgi:ATP-binding cassette subfamily B protein